MITRRKKRSCSTPRNEGVKSESIPFDLVIEILLRLPVKSITRFRSVSKLWQSTLRAPHFTDSFLTKSSSRPKILFTCLKDGETFFFSSPHPDQDLSPIAVNVHMSFPSNCSSHVSRPVRGFVCGLHQQTIKGTTVTLPLICNPSTGQSLALPKVKARRKRVMNFFGFDPIDKNFKLLSMTTSRGRSFAEDHQVLTLETGKKASWQMINCDILHHPAVVEHNYHGFPKYDGICINGVLYYLAYLAAVVYDVFDGYSDIVCFELRSEKFSCIKQPDQYGMGLQGELEPTLVNYKGKLAKLRTNFTNNGCSGIQLWVLKDAEKHEWSRYIYVLPPPWRHICEETKLCFVGTTGKGEIVLSPNSVSDFFYLLYYSPERNTIDIVSIKGMETIKGHKAYTFLDHVEDVNACVKFSGS